MAPFAKHLFFIFVLLFSSIHIQARESKFFSKFTHYSTKRNVSKDSTTSHIEAPTPAPAPAPGPAVISPAPALSLPPAPIYAEIERGYGVFGHGSGSHPTKDTTTTTSITSGNELLNEELDGVTYERGYDQRSNYNNNGYTTGHYNNNGYSGNNNYNGYKLGSARYETGNENNDNGYTGNYNGYKLASESHDTADNYQSNENGYTNSNIYANNYYNSNGYETERQGMSDTRFVEGGKYFFDMKNENYDAVTKQGYKTENPYEFNTMEEYENQRQVAYDETQDEFSP